MLRKVWPWVGAHPIWTIFLTFGAFLIGGHFVANWRSERAWQQYCEAARARGVKLTLAEIAPPPVPDDQNFAELPMWKALFANQAARTFGLPEAANGATEVSRSAERRKDGLARVAEVLR